MAGRVRIGISGWTYPPWRGGFYPKGLAQAKELSYAAQRFSSIEINGTFYGLRRPADFVRWHEQTPVDFVFAVKAPRYITHELRLSEAETPLANFFASGLLALGAKLGPILWQLPPSLPFEPGRLDAFLRLLPHTGAQALTLARRHDAHVKDRVFLEVENDLSLRHAVEIRHDSFRTPQFVDLLRAHGVALVCADTVDWPLLTDLTADFVYARLHGSEELYVSGYDEEALDLWAERIRLWAKGGEPREGEHLSRPLPPLAGGRDVFLYFDNTYKQHRAPLDAQALVDRL